MEPPGSDQEGHFVEVRVPASTSNLGAGFDCFGLALKLYLRVRASIAPESAEPCVVLSLGGGTDASLPRDEDNLIFRAMSYTAEHEGLKLPPVRLTVRSEIPLASGLGSSAAAIVAGVALCGALQGQAIPKETILKYATALEGHQDNVSAAIYGTWVTTAVRDDGSVLAIKRPWPANIRIVVITPHIGVDTARARAVLSPQVTRNDAVFNLQRVGLLNAVLETGSYDLLWDAMQDRLHQPERKLLVPGLTEALATPRLPGLLGVALSGAGPSVLALAHDNFDEIGNRIAANFREHNLPTTVRVLETDEAGMQLNHPADGEPVPKLR
jgi:homoserine kinase